MLNRFTYVRLLLEGQLKSDSSRVIVNLILIQFEDENKVHFIYSPHLDLAVYGKTPEEARKSFKLALEDLIDYTLNNKTLLRVLSDLGREINDRNGKPQKLLAPGITSVISDNNYVAEILDKYPVKTFHQKIALPVML